MKWFIVCFWASAIYCVQTQPTEEFTELHYQQWDSFKNQFVKSYETEDEDTYRMKIFVQNSREIARHNELYKQGVVSFELGMNEYGDLSEEEFNRLMTSDYSSYLNKSMEELGVSEFTPPDNVAIPSSLDWRRSGAVTPVKNQRQCGSCWAFSSTGALEGQMFLRRRRRVLLSEQNLVDCSTPYGNHGCNGGFMTNAYQYIRRNGGIDSERSYPYEARDANCRYRPQSRAAGVTNAYMLRGNNEEKLRQTVATVGPIAVVIQSSTQQFRFYKRGVMYIPGCGHHLDHAVLAVGYGREGGRDYWLVKNSWGTTWGTGGYGKMARNMQNNCGIASYPVYPAV